MSIYSFYQHATQHELRICKNQPSQARLKNIHQHQHWQDISYEKCSQEIYLFFNIAETVVHFMLNQILKMHVHVCDYPYTTDIS